MQIESINIRRKYDGHYACEVTIDGEYQSMKLRLDAEHTQAVIGVIADLIVEGSQQVAANLTKQALDHKAIEHQPPADPIPY